MTDRRIDLSETYYGNWANVYDRFATAPGIQSWRVRAAETLSLSRGDTVVEMGCGTGANFPYLRERVGAEGRVVGVDLVPAMVGEAQRRIDRAGWENVHAVCGDATRPPVSTADALLSTFVVGMLDSPEEVVRSWVRLVEPGGRVTLLNAERSNRPLVRPLNLACRAFVRLTAPGYRLRPTSPVRDLEARWQDASETLFEGTVDHVDERLGAGFVTLASGQVPGRRGTPQATSNVSLNIIS